MSGPKTTAKPQPEEPQVGPTQGIQLLQTAIVKAKELLSHSILDSSAYSSWELLVRNYLEKAFGRNSPNISSVLDVGKYGGFPMGAAPEWWNNHRRKSLSTQTQKLESLKGLLETELQLSGGQTASVNLEPKGHKIFLVHGHDDSVLHECARFLEKLKQDVIVLREQPNQGRTIIEKFEDYADVGFAIILLTPDDVGSAVVFTPVLIA